MSGHAGLLRTLIDAAPDALVVIDETGRIERFSRAAERQFGWTEAELRGSNVSRLMPEPHRDRHDAYLRRYLATGERRVIGIGRVAMGLRRDGSTFPMELSVVEARVGRRRVFAGFIRDLAVTETHQGRVQELQSRLAEQARVQAMGQLGAVLAHEVNQPLTAIGSYLAAAGRLLEQPVRAHAALAAARAETQRAGEIIRQLRARVNAATPVLRSEPAAALIEAAAALALLGAGAAGVRPEVVLAPDLPAVLADPLAIQQVLLALIRNAIEAMAPAGDRNLRIGAEVVAGMLRIDVADHGAGVPAAVRAQLFQPFATTRAGAIGIGLATCRNIVEAHGGRIWMEDNVPRGTVFRFTLKLAA